MSFQPSLQGPPLERLPRRAAPVHLSGPAGPACQAESGGFRATSFHACFSLLRRSDTQAVGNITSGTVTSLRQPAGPASDQPSGSSMSFQPSIHLIGCQRGTTETAVQPQRQVSVSPHPPGQPARDGEVEGTRSRQVGARSESTYIQPQPNTYIYPVQRWRRSAAAAQQQLVLLLPLPPGKPARRKKVSVGPLLSMLGLFCEGQTQSAT